MCSPKTKDSREEENEREPPKESQDSINQSKTEIEIDQR